MIKYILELILVKIKWRLRNKHNGTAILNLCNIDNAEVGRETYGSFKIFCSAANVKLKIGNYCSLAHDVVFLLGDEHITSNFSTYHFKTKYGLVEREAVSKGDIVIKDDVWIGYGAIILSGVTVGQGAVIGAGSVVTKDIPPYAIAVGNPARIIKYRFSDNIIKELIKVDYSKIDRKMVERNIEYFYQPITKAEQLKWIIEGENT